MAKALIMEDLSALNQISSLAAVPLLTAQGHQPALLPTVMLSTQTEGFGQPAQQALTTFIDATLQHWQTLAVNFAGLLIGYVGNAQLLMQLRKRLATMTIPIRVLDPVLGDNGKLYPGLTSATVTAMQQMLSQATVITPNWTELGWLVNQPWQRQPAISELQRAMQTIQACHPQLTVVVTGVHYERQVGCAWLEADQLRFIGAPPIPGHFYGTGDVFAALLLGYLLCDYPIVKAIQAAQAGVAFAVAASRTCTATERLDGLRLTALLQQLAKEGIRNEK